MRFRIEWKIGQGSGHGDWHQDRSMLESFVKDANRRYGTGTHWIAESEDAQCAQEIASALIDRVSSVKAMSVDDLKALWDAYDGTNCPDGWSGEAIHSELNARGLGAYCAI